MNRGDKGEKGYERNFWRGRAKLKEVRGEGYGEGQNKGKEGDVIEGKSWG